MANETIDVTMAPVLPDCISEMDLLKLELGQEKLAKYAAQKDSLTLQINTITEQLQKTQTELQQFVDTLGAKYMVSGEDSYDKVTGRITRKTAVP